MAVPRNRTSNARKNSRRSHMAKKPTQLATCKNCQNLYRPHHICPSCGYYANKAIIQKQDEGEKA